MAIFELDKIIELKQECENDNEFTQNIRKALNQIATNEKEINMLKQTLADLRLKRMNESSQNITINPTQKFKRRNYTSKNVDVSVFKELLELSESLDDLNSFLPKSDDPIFDDVINQLMLELQKDLVEYFKLTKELDSNEFENYAKHINRLKSLLLEYKESFQTTEQIELTSDENNTLAYVKTSSGNIKIFNDIKMIGNTADLQTLFNILINGDIDHKAFALKDQLKPLYEIRYNDLRAIFAKFNHVLYVVGIFEKKVYNSSYYKQTMSKMKSTFDSTEEYIRSNINNQDFLEEQESITQQILSSFKNKSKVKAKAKPAEKKSGDSNG